MDLRGTARTCATPSAANPLSRSTLASMLRSLTAQRFAFLLTSLLDALLQLLRKARPPPSAPLCNTT